MQNWPLSPRKLSEMRTFKPRFIRGKDKKHLHPQFCFQIGTEPALKLIGETEFEC